jgi:hypothetical protein
LILRLGAFDDDGITVDNPGLTGHIAITMDTTRGSGPDVALLTSWSSGLSHTRQAGSNRLLIFTAHCEDDSSDMHLSSVTYGGRPMTQVIEKNVGTGSRAYVVAYILNEAGVSAASSSNFVVTWQHTPSVTPGYSSVLLQNIDQGNPIGASASNATTSSSTISTSALPTNDGDMVIVAGACGNTGNYSVNNGFNKAIELTMTSSDGVAGYKQASGANETPSITHDNVNRQVIIGFTVKVAGGTGTVSGGAGYILQPTSGDSGTSTFSLGSPNQSQTLTIAIAPDSVTVDSGSGSVRP